MVAEKGISPPILSAHNASQQSYKLIPSPRKTRGVKTLGGARQEGTQAAAAAATQNKSVNSLHLSPFPSDFIAHAVPSLSSLSLFLIETVASLSQAITVLFSLWLYLDTHCLLNNCSH